MPEEGQVIPVKVALRCRPLIPKETEEGCQTCLSFVPGEPQLILGANKSFTYDYVFSADTPQHEVYDHAISSLVDGIFKGYNATVLAYGQTGSGKTFSMGGGYGVSVDTDESILGVIPRVIRALFNGINDRNDFDFTVKVSYLEIYMEDLMDLLVPVEKRDKDTVTIREDASGIKLNGLSEIAVHGVDDTMQCLESGSLSRTTGSTAMNNSSSRSHAIFTMHIDRTNKADSQDFCSCKFHLVDLAGSERQKRTRAEGDRLKEGININKGLLALGNVISALGDEAQRAKHVPYRDSKLTRLLQDSLGGNSHTVMIACVSPADSNMEETLSTLRYADRARKIKNKPVVNRDPQVAEILRLRQLVGDLQSSLLSSGKTLLKRDSGGAGPAFQQDSEDMKAIREKNIHLIERNKNLQQELEQAWEQNEQHCTRIIVLETRKDVLQEKLDKLKDKLVSLNENTPEGAEVAEVVQGMIHDLMGQIDDIEKTQNENFENYLNSINESQDGSSNSDGEHNQGKQDAEEKPKADKIEMDKISEEMKQKFNERRAQLSRDLGELNKKLELKQCRADDMKLSSEMYDQIKGEYEENIKKMNAQIDNLQNEKENLETQLQEKKVATNTAKLNETRRKRIMELEAEVSRKKREIVDSKKMIKMKEQTVKDSEKLGTEIQSLKVQRVQLMKQMKADGDIFRKFKQQKDKEVLQLKAKERKKQVEITKLERKNTQQQNILKRKNEETNALTRRLNEALMKQKKVLEERVRKEETQVSIGKGANVKRFLGHELEIMVGIQEAKEHREELVKDRADITKELSKLKKKLDDYSPPNKKRILNNSTEKAMNEEKLNFEKEIREYENHLAIKNSQINEINAKMLELEGDTNEKLRRSRFQDIKTLVDARIGFNYLLNSASQSKVEYIKQKSRLHTLKESNEELSSQIESTEKEHEKLRTEHDEQLDELKQMHENKMLFMLKQMQNRSVTQEDSSTNAGVPDKNLKIRLKFQEEEINKLSHLKDTLEQKDEAIDGLQKQVTKLTYSARCMSTGSSLMPDLNDSGKPSPCPVGERASFFTPAVLQTPGIQRVQATTSRLADSVGSINEIDEFSDEDSEDDFEEELVEDDGDDERDSEWQQGQTPGYSQAQNNARKLKAARGVSIASMSSTGKASPAAVLSFPAANEMCGCKGTCNTKRCKCRKVDAFCSDNCDCGDKCSNREEQLPQSTTNDEDLSSSNMNVTFIKDVSSSSDILRDTLNQSSKNKRSLDTSSETSSIAIKYRKSGETTREGIGKGRENVKSKDTDMSDSAGIMEKKKRKLGTKKSQFFNPV